MNAFTGANRTDSKMEMFILADIDFKIPFILAKNNIIGTVEPVIIHLKC